MIWRQTVFFALSAIMFAFSSSNVWACTGRPYAAEMSDIHEFDLCVRATVIEWDDRGFNAILRADAYYKGEGPRLLVVKRHLPALESVTVRRGYSNGCLGNGGGQRYHKEMSGYFGLKSNHDGTYTDWHFGSSLFIPWDGVIRYFEDYEWKEIAESEFIAKLLKLGGRDAPVDPIVEEVQRYPLMRYLMITTENGTRYQVNPDRSVKTLPASAPFAMSPDGAHWALRLDEDTLGIGRPYTRQGNPSVPYFSEVSGRDLLFSNDSNMAAVWDESQLSIYLFSIADFNYRGGGMGMDRIAVVDINAIGRSAPRVIWSADSTTLAWQDASGIWRWNLYEEEQPTLAVADHDCHLIDISSGGRYLRYGTARGWTLLDSSSGKRYRNALAAPGETGLVFINSDDEPVPPMRDGSNCKPPLQQDCALYLDTMVKPVELHVYPRKDGKFGLLFCEFEGLCEDRRFSWNRSALWHGYYEFDPDMDKERWRQYAYDPYYDQKAILYGDYRIDFETYLDWGFTYGFASDRPRDTLDLEGIVDSPVASIEWGQPIFYDSFILTATEYLPRTVTIAGSA